LKTAPFPAEFVRAVGYLRASTGHQDQSCPAQRSELERYAAAHGFVIVAWYVDDGVSGSRDDREEFRRLIADAERGNKFTSILVWDQDRFSRFDALEANHYWFILRRAGVFIESIRQGKLDFDTLAGWLTASITQVGKHDFLKSLSANVKRGKARSREAGKYQGGNLAYGYAMSRSAPDSHGVARLDGKPKPHPEAAPVVARIFKRCAEGASGFGIAKELNEAGVPSPGDLSGIKAGARWSTRQIMIILRRTEYGTGEFKVGTNVVPCEPLVSREIFAAASRRLARTAAGPRKAGTFALTGLAWCAACGGRMSGSTVNGYRYMRCSGANLCPGSCSGTFVSEKPLLTAAIATITEAIPTESAWDSFLAAVEVEVRRGQTDHPDSSRLEKKLADLNSKIEKASKRLFDCDDDILPEATAALRALKSERDALTSQVAAKAPREKVDVRAEVERAIANLSRLRDELASGDAIRLRAALGELIDRIDIRATAEGGQRVRRGIITFRPLAVCSGCQSGMLPKSPAAPGTAAATSDAVAITTATTDAPRIEPGDFAEGYRQPKGSAIPPRIPMGKTLQTSAVKQVSAVK